MFAAQAFWDFSLTFYKKPEVEQACLTLQDSYDCQVNLLLLALWAGLKGVSLPADFFLQPPEAFSTWHKTVTLPLRASRRQLKTLLQGPDEEAFYQGLKALELQAERLEQERLIKALPQNLKRQQARSREAVVAGNLQACFAASAKKPSDASLAALTVLMQAACPGLLPLAALALLTP